MAKIAYYCGYDARVQDDIFLEGDRNEYQDLADRFKINGHEIHTLDVYHKKNITPNVCIFLDIPRVNINTLVDRGITQAVALLRECPHILPLNYDKNRHKEFDQIFTWMRNLVDESHFFYFPSTRFFRDNSIRQRQFDDKKLLTLVSSNLYSKVPGELYSERRKVIDWMENYKGCVFDFYGYGWDRRRVDILGHNLLSTRFFVKKYKNYKGPVSDKLQTLAGYKYSICFENTSGEVDYVTEKIFDAFLAKNVPIYYGAPNIKDIIPSDCYIDYRDFANISDLKNYLERIDEARYTAYLDAAESFMTIAKYKVADWVNSIYLKMEERLAFK